MLLTVDATVGLRARPGTTRLTSADGRRQEEGARSLDVLDPHACYFDPSLTPNEPMVATPRTLGPFGLDIFSIASDAARAAPPPCLLRSGCRPPRSEARSFAWSRCRVPGARCVPRPFLWSDR